MISFDVLTLSAAIDPWTPGVIPFDQAANNTILSPPGTIEIPPNMSAFLQGSAGFRFALGTTQTRVLVGFHAPSLVGVPARIVPTTSTLVSGAGQDEGVQPIAAAYLPPSPSGYSVTLEVYEIFGTAPYALMQNSVCLVTLSTSQPVDPSSPISDETPYAFTGYDDSLPYELPPLSDETA